jgi:hypothetical protein
VQGLGFSAGGFAEAGREGCELGLSAERDRAE